MKIGTREFDTLNNTYIMGILNVTPDSFSDGGDFSTLDSALFHAEEMISQGVDIIDIGGESTRPGYTLISDDEEINRVVPVINAIRQRFDIPISLDTYKSQVAQAGIDAGADMINDIWGLKYDSQMASVIAGYENVSCCLMQNRDKAEYSSLIEDICDDLRESVRIAEAAGIESDRIVLDPGVGFGKTYEHNLEVIKNLGQFNTLGFPVLLGASRKSVIGLTLELPASERIEGTLVTTVAAVNSHTAFVRVHDVEANKRAIKMAMAIRDI